MTPAWHQRPTEPGLWLCRGGEWSGAKLADVAIKLSQADIDRGLPVYTECVYGPIPEPPQEQP